MGEARWDWEGLSVKWEEGGSTRSIEMGSERSEAGNWRSELGRRKSKVGNGRDVGGSGRGED